MCVTGLLSLGWQMVEGMTRDLLQATAFFYRFRAQHAQPGEVAALP